MSEFTINWSQADQLQWDQWHRAADGALQQSWGYGEAIRKNGPSLLVHRAVVTRNRQVVAAAQFIVRRFGGVIPVALCSRGPLWLDGATASQRQTIYQALKRTMPASRPRLILFSPDDPEGSQIGTQRLRRVMTGYSTVRIDLTQSCEQIREQFHGKWRNRLVTAEASALRVSRLGTKPRQYAWLLERESQQRQARAYQTLPSNFVEAFQQVSDDPGQVLLTLRADLGKDAVAAMMFLIHGSTATYHIGWSDDQGRANNAHNLLLWHAIQNLKSSGVRFVELGGVDTQRGAGIARFKIGSGGQVHTFAGTFC